jgi:hypothetical protein
MSAAMASLYLGTVCFGTIVSDSFLSLVEPVPRRPSVAGTDPTALAPVSHDRGRSFLLTVFPARMYSDDPGNDQHIADAEARISPKVICGVVIVSEKTISLFCQIQSE